MHDHGGDKGEGYDDCRGDCQGICLFLLVSEFVCAELVFDNFVVIGRFEVGEFSPFGPAGVLVASAMRAKGGVFFEGCVAVGAVHA